MGKTETETDRLGVRETGQTFEIERGEREEGGDVYLFVKEKDFWPYLPVSVYVCVCPCVCVCPLF